MRRSHWPLLTAVLAMTAFAGNCDSPAEPETPDPAGIPDAAQPPPENAGQLPPENEVEPVGNPSPSRAVLSNRTCHDRNAGGGLSDQEIVIATPSPAGATIEATFTVANPADGAPAVRTVTAEVASNGTATLIVPLYAEGEQASLTSITGPNISDGDYGDDLNFTVAGFTEDTNCDEVDRAAETSEVGAAGAGAGAALESN